MEITMTAKDKASVARPRLGRGLSSLISTSSATADAPGEPTTPATHHGKVAIPVGPSRQDATPNEVPIDDISPNPYQPRKEFNPSELQELSESIKRQGILQPLLVARLSDVGATPPYILIAGERRLRAARLAGLATVPCVIRHATQQQMIEWALIENIQRSDLNPIEKAAAYRQYLDRFHLTQEDAAQQLGQARATVANYLRLLDLSSDIQDMISQNKLSFGHAKVLAGLASRPDLQAQLAQRAVADGLSVRQLEALAAKTAADDQPAASASSRAKPAYLRDLEERLTAAVGTHVKIYPGRSKHTGRIMVEYYSLDDFDRISAGLGLANES
jgi:ParB family chromosome partitioning protein